MVFFGEPLIFKKILEPYTSLVFGPYFNTAILLIFGILLAVPVYFVPRQHRLRVILAASILFALISSSIANLLIFSALVFILFICSSYNFKFRNVIFWTAEGLLLMSNMIIYRIFGLHSLYYSFAAYYTVYRTIHYFVDVNQGSLEKKKLFDYLGYLYFFPTFSHAPIERAENLNASSVTRDQLIFGLKRIFIGILKYAFLLHVLSKINAVPFSFQNFWQWLVLTAYIGAIKLYVLFSGDVDIVIGIASLMGFKLSENFPKFPYFQPTLTKFWQNWQATIVNWLTAYVYYPLCRNRKNLYLKTMVIIMIIGWAHLFYSFKDFPSIELVMYYTLWGVFLGGALALSKVIEKKKAEKKQYMLESHPKIAKIIYADNIFTKGVGIFITFNIIAVGWLSPLYILIKQFA